MPGALTLPPDTSGKSGSENRPSTLRLGEHPFATGMVGAPPARRSPAARVTNPPGAHPEADPRQMRLTDDMALNKAAKRTQLADAPSSGTAMGKQSEACVPGTSRRFGFQ